MECPHPNFIQVRFDTQIWKQKSRSAEKIDYKGIQSSENPVTRGEGNRVKNAPHYVLLAYREHITMQLAVSTVFLIMGILGKTLKIATGLVFVSMALRCNKYLCQLWYSLAPSELNHFNLSDYENFEEAGTTLEIHIRNTLSESNGKTSFNVRPSRQRLIK